MSIQIGCVIMAAGRSTRFGSNKLLAPLAGKPVLAHVLDGLPRARLARTVVVTVAGKVPGICGELPVRLNESGLLSESVRRGIEPMAGLDGCLFVMGDQPLCSTDSILNLLDAFTREPDTVHRLAYNGVPGSPVVFPAALFPRLAALEGESSGMTAAKGSGVPVRLVPAAHEWELWDVDTPEALAKAQSILTD